LERTIGLLGSRIRQHSRPYEIWHKKQCAELSVRQSALLMHPLSFLRLNDLLPTAPPLSEILSASYVLMRRMCNYPLLTSAQQSRLIFHTGTYLMLGMVALSNGRDCSYRIMRLSAQSGKRSSGPLRTFASAAMSNTSGLLSLRLTVLDLLSFQLSYRRHDPLGVLITCQPALPG
ncbi:hypothetical protein BT69DRAFT_1376206, partial [Atractiella rhizophila]